MKCVYYWGANHLYESERGHNFLTAIKNAKVGKNKFDTGDAWIVADNVDDVINYVLLASNTKNKKGEFIYSSSDIFYEDTGLIFYNTNVTSLQEAISAMMLALQCYNTNHPQALVHKTVTEISKEVVNTNVTLNYSLETQNFLKKFYTEFGTHIHECILYNSNPAEFARAKKELVDFLKDLHDNYLTLNVRNELGTILLDHRFYVVDHPESVTDSQLDELVHLVMSQSIFNGFTEGSNMFFELEVAAVINGVEIRGVIDCILFHPDGTVTIIDFKTSGRDSMSSDSEKQHYALLFLYEQILGLYGIPAKNIKYRNLTINYLGGFNNTNPEIKQPLHNTTRRLSADMGQIRSYIKLHYIPFSHSAVQSTEARQIASNIISTTRLIFSDDRLQRDDPEHLKKYIENLGDKLFKVFSKNKELYTITIDGDDYILTKAGTATLERISIDTFIDQELKERKDFGDSEFEAWKDAISKGDINAIKVLQSGKYAKKDTRFVKELMTYCNGDWSVYSPVLDANGHYACFPPLDQQHCIALINDSTKELVILSLVSSTDLDSIYTLNTENGIENMRLLGNLLHNNFLKNIDLARVEASIGNISILRAMAATAACSKLFPEGYTISDIVAISQTSTKMTSHLNYDDFKNQFKVIKYADSKNQLDVDNKLAMLNICDSAIGMLFTDPIKKIHSKITSTLATLSYNLGILVSAIQDPAKYYSLLMDDSLVESLNDIRLGQSSPEEVVRSLENIQDQLREEYPDSFNRKRADQLYTDDIQSLDMLISNLISAVEHMAPDNLRSMSSMAVDWNNSVRAAAQMLKQGYADFVADGTYISGLLLGLSTATPYAQSDESVRLIANQHTYATTRIQKEVEKFVNDLNRETKRFLDAMGASLAGLALLGNYVDLYEALFEHDSNGNISKDYRFYNPFDINSPLNDAQKRYIKVSLWNFMRMKKGLGNDFTDEMRTKTFAELENDSEFLRSFEEYLILNSAHRNVPLKRATDSKLVKETAKSVIKGDFSDAWKLVKNQLDKAKHWADPRGLTDIQEKDKQLRFDELQSYNIYKDLDSETRNRRIEKEGINGFEHNINFLVNDYLYTYVTCEVNDKILRQTDRMLAGINYIEQVTGRNLKGLKEEILKRTKISLYNSNTVDDDYKDLSGVVGYLRGALNLGSIAFRPVLFAKEITVGRIKNYLYAGMGYFKNDNITMQDMLKAELIVFKDGIIEDRAKRVIGQRQKGDDVKVEAINKVYRIANMDANVVSRKTTYDKGGLFSPEGDLAYYTNIRPDWYNRMALFVAKMLADGTWGAHSVNAQGELEYDMAKDKRYEIYFQYKDNEPHPGDTNYDEYLQQKARYAWAVRALQTQNVIGPDFHDGDKLPLCYTGEETNSVKELIGMLYGYYNHEERTSFQTGTYSSLFMSFKTYLAGELHHYFALPNKGTSIGKVQQAKDVDGSLLYEHHTLDGLTVITKEKETVITNSDGTTTTVQNTPKYDWTGDPVEGLVVSTFMCAKDLFTPEGREDLRKNKYRRKNMELFLIRGIAALFGAAILAMLIKGFNSETNAGVQLSAKVLDKSIKDLSFYHSVIEPADDLGIVGVDYLEKLFQNFTASATNADKSLMDGFKNIAMLGDFTKLK